MEYAYIFDFDGVLINSMGAHFECYKKALEEAGVPIEREQFYRQAGMTALEQIGYFCRKAGKQPDVNAIYRRKRELFKDYIDLTTPIDCNIQLLKILKENGVRVAIASGSSRPSILPVMEKFGIIVDVLVSTEDVTKGKPNPDLFLCAAQKLGVAPGNCIVIEDSDAGIEAARAAGMRCLRFYNN
ncbi:MAG: HAD family hydrolase [Saccharofermentanales bacterium]